MSETITLITADPKIMGGKPCIKGTRLTVELILRELALGLSVPELLHQYPTLTEAGIRAALAYAHAVLADDRIELAPA